jgi:hypothetical protein
MSFLWQEEDGEHRGDWEFEMRFFFRYEIEHLVARSKLVPRSDPRGLRGRATHGGLAGIRGRLPPAET